MSQSEIRSGLKVVYAKELHPKEVTKSIMLCGPSPRDKDTTSWRPKAIELLEKLGYDGHVFVPEPRDGKFSGDYIDQVEWETAALSQADSIVFWVPRDMKTMPALTTNVEFGVWADSGKVVLGTPAEAEHVRYLQYMATKLKIPNYSTLDATLEEAVQTLGKGALRTGGEAQVPLLVWDHPTFQRWNTILKQAGNRLDKARILWTYRDGPQRDKVFCWVLKVSIWITSENRSKTCEFVFGRTDTSSVVLFHKPNLSGYGVLWETEVILVREFRSPGRNQTGFVTELPGGSAYDDSVETRQVAIDELKEETSFSIDPSRLRELSTLQQSATLSAHTNTVFYAEVTEAERNKLVALDQSGKTFGVEKDTERTYVKVQTVREMVFGGLVDWSTLGMVLLSIMDSTEPPGPYTVY